MAIEKIYKDRVLDKIYPVKVKEEIKDKALNYCKMNNINLSEEVRKVLEKYSIMYDDDTLKGLNDGNYKRR